MKYVITDSYGKRIGQAMSDRKAMRQVARSLIRAGQRIMIYLATDDGVIQRYSSDDMQAVRTAR